MESLILSKAVMLGVQVGWIDFSPEERSRTLTVLRALSAPGSVDELGIGIVRDAVADALFPGTSTLLTKARYFFLVPYLSRLLEEGHDAIPRDARDLKHEFDGLERRCAVGLCKRAADLGISDEGVIGRVALTRGPGQWVTRGPGEVYWASIRALGFMKDDAPDSYLGHFAYLANRRTATYGGQFDGSDTVGLSDDKHASRSMWNLSRTLFESWREDWDDWGSRASIELRTEEAALLGGRIKTQRPGSLYALIVGDDRLRGLALGSWRAEGGGYADSAFHSFLEQERGRIEELSPEVARLCALADDFSELVYGCRIAYNMQLPGLEEEAAEEWEAFAESEAIERAAAVDLDALSWELGLSDHSGYSMLAAFLRRAMACMASRDLAGLKYEVRQRESEIKGSRKKIGSGSEVEYAWRGGRRLPYRFGYAMSIVDEIVKAGGCDA